MKSTSSFTRRRFLQASAFAAASPFILPSGVWAAETSPNEQITLGVIGIGRMGRDLINAFLRHPDVRITALCEVDATRLEDQANRVNNHYAGNSGVDGYKGCAAFRDFREMLARDDIDGVVIATPDHWHAIMAILAVQAGKDVYCEKPLCQTVEEAEAMVRATRATDRVFQTGSQQRSVARFRNACEWVRNGRIGEIRRVAVALPEGLAGWCDLEEKEAPEGLDWDLWLGPARKRGWNEVLSPVGVYSHYPMWRLYREYGGGMVTDWGAHHVDIIQWALGMDESGPVEILPAPKSGLEEGARFFYRNGVEVMHVTGNGLTFFGSEGEIFVNRRQLSISPTDLAEAAEPGNPVRLYRSNDHHRNWLDCIKSRKKPICDVETGARSVVACHLLNFAYWYGKPFAWDPASYRFFSGAVENDWLRATYRDPWKLPGV